MRINTRHLIILTAAATGIAGCGEREPRLTPIASDPPGAETVPTGDAVPGTATGPAVVSGTGTLSAPGGPPLPPGGRTGVQIDRETGPNAPETVDPNSPPPRTIPPTAPDR